MITGPAWHLLTGLRKVAWHFASTVHATMQTRSVARGKTHSCLPAPSHHIRITSFSTSPTIAVASSASCPVLLRLSSFDSSSARVPRSPGLQGLCCQQWHAAACSWSRATAALATTAPTASVSWQSVRGSPGSDGAGHGGTRFVRTNAHGTQSFRASRRASAQHAPGGRTSDQEWGP